MPAPDLEARDAHYHDVLANLLDDGSGIVRDLACEDGPAVHKAEPYERLARAIRRTIVLARHVDQNPLKVRQPPTEATGPKASPSRPSAQPGAPAGDPDTGSLRPERPDRMHEDLTSDLEITRLPIDAAIGEIRRDLGHAEAQPQPGLARFAKPVRQPLYVDADDIDDLETDEVLLHDTILRRGKTRDG